MQNYPESYEILFQNSFCSDEPTKNGIAITKALVQITVKNTRPTFIEEEKYFSANCKWRARIEVKDSNNQYYYIFDAGQGFGHYDVESFKARCEDFGTVSPSISYCDNMPMILPTTEKPGIHQRTGTIKVYVLKDNGLSSDSSRRMADDMASAFVKAINDLPDHFVVVDNATLRLL